MTGYINVMLVLQSCTDPLHILPGSSAVSSDCAYQVGNLKVEGVLDMQEEEGEGNVKTEKVSGIDEVEYIGIKEEVIYSEEEEEEEKDIDTKEEEDVDIKEEVSLVGTIQCFRK